MKISFGMIIFNGEVTLPENMLKLCIQNVYDIAHEIIIVEGATRALTHKFDGDTRSFTKNGSSTDNTIKIIKSIEDKDNKIKLIESEGFWDGKTEMCNRYAKVATGDYIWQLDSDEFYHKDDMKKIISVLDVEKPDAVHFYANHFFGDYNHCINESGKKWANCLPWMRIFRHVPYDSKWISHEPPEYMCGNIKCNKGKVITREDTLNMGIKLYHYSYVSKRQFDFKATFFRRNEYIKYWNEFSRGRDVSPFGDNVIPFKGSHPNIIKENYVR